MQIYEKEKEKKEKKKTNAKRLLKIKNACFKI